KQCPARCEIAGQARRVRHVPGVDDLALQVDEIHVPVLHEVRSKQRKSRKGALWLARAQPNAPSFDGVLLDRGHERVTSNDGARSERGKAGEQRASLQGPGLMIDHRTPSIPMSATAKTLAMLDEYGPRPLQDDIDHVSRYQEQCNRCIIREIGCASARSVLSTLASSRCSWMSLVSRGVTEKCACCTQRIQVRQ